MAFKLSTSMSDERIIATYRIETPLPLEQATAVRAGEQSSGTFVNVPDETDELRWRYGTTVESITPLDESKTPALPGPRMKGNRGLYRRADVRVSWSIENFGYNLPTIISTLQGNLYEFVQFSGLRLSDVEFPASFGRHFAGPKLGAAGTRKTTGVQGRPLIGTTIKPGIGLLPQQAAELFSKLVAADIDFIAWQRFWRLAGVDQMHVNGIANKICEDDDSVVRSIAACAQPLVGTPPVLPVVSSGQTSLQAPETYRRTKTIDLLYQAGGGIMTYPGGPGAGVTALRPAWEAAVAGKTLADYAAGHPELRQSMNKFAGAHA